MSAVETLREAAQLMRERAEGATAGPWKRFGMAGVAAPDWEIVDERRIECDDCGEPVALLGCVTNGDAEHIAALDPTVALAVADWLDVVVADTTLKCGSYTYPDAGNVPDHALAVARAYLRIEES